MEEQIAVEYLIEASLGVQESDVLLQLLTALEGGGELIDHTFLLRCEGIGVLRVHCGEISILQRIGDIPNGNAAVLIVDLVQQKPVSHIVFRVTEQLLPLQLEQDDGDGLVHPGREQLILLAVLVGVRPGKLHRKPMDVAVSVFLIGKHGQWTQGDAVPRLDNFQVVVMD